MSDKPPLPWDKLRWWVILLILSPWLITAGCDIVAAWMMHHR